MNGDIHERNADMKKVILCPNPYRDSDLKVAERSKKILEETGIQTVICLRFQQEGAA